MSQTSETMHDGASVLQGATCTRRGLIRGAALGAAGAAAVMAVGSAVASEEAPAEAPAEAGEDFALMPGTPDYVNIYEEGINPMPAWGATCPGPRGPIAYEACDIGDDEIVRTEEFDVVVAGAGVGGLMAALKAADMGANVLLLEKMTVGRACFESFGAVGAACQEGTEIDKVELVDELLRSAYWRVRPDPIRTYVDRSGEVTDFWQAILDKGPNGFIITKVAGTPSTTGMPALTMLIDSELGFYDSPCLPADASSRAGLSGIYVCREMTEIVQNVYDNIDLRFETPAVQLIREGERVTGVIAKDADGYFRVNASKGVIMATGGYDANPEMMEVWTRPEDYATSSWWNPGWGTTGDGHMMALAIGAEMDPIPQPIMNFRWGSPDSYSPASTWMADYFGILVNGRGQRFVREDLPFQAVSNAQNAQPNYGMNCWEVFDSAMLMGMEVSIPELEEKGWLFEGSSPEELAEAAGIDPEGLAATVARYNEMYMNGVDEDFGRLFMATMPFTGGTYYALTTNSCVLTTVGGLTIDGNCSVLDPYDHPIPGLYACGNASGNFFAGNYPRHIPGTSIGRAVTLGYVAAENAVNGTIDPGPINYGNAAPITVYSEGAAVDEATLESSAELGLWDPYDSIHGSSSAYTPEQLGGLALSCNNCHTYDPSAGTVADSIA